MKRSAARSAPKEKPAADRVGTGRPTPARRALGLHRFSWVEAGRVLLLLGVILVVWCIVYNRTTVSSWQTPLEYGIEPEFSDAKCTFAFMKAAMDGDFVPFLYKSVPHLGAPYVASWNDFPIPEEFLYYGTGLLARLIGLFPAVNFAVLLEFLLAGGAFYVTCRMLRCSWEWAFVGALAFAFSRYAFAQGLHHLTTTYAWHVPLFLLVCKWMSTGSGLRFGTRHYYFAVGVGLLTGIQSVYYTNYFAHFVALACVIQWFRHGWRAMLAPASIVVVSALGFAAMNVHTFVFHFMEGPNPNGMARDFKWLEIYGLKLVDLFIPPPDHRFEPFAALGKSYFSKTVLPGEIPPSCYLGLAGIAGLLWLAGTAFVRTLRRPPRPLALETLQTAWISIYSIIGGANCFLGALGLLIFRSTNRSTIVLLPIVLIFAVQRISALSRRWLPLSRLGIAAAAALLIFCDQLPPQTSQADIDKTAAVVASDKAFTKKLEQRLPSGAMVFQVPIMEFPESPAPGVSSYEEFRPYFFTDRLHFSFGSVKGRPREQWQLSLTKLPFPEVVSALESYGFSAIYIDRRGFPDRGASIVSGLKTAGRGEIIQDSIGELACVILNPSPHPVQPFSVY